MEAAAGLLLLLMGVCHGGETHCDGRGDGAWCYGAPGGTVVIQLMDNASEIHRYDWKKDGTTILNGRKNSFIINNIETRSVFIPNNGTFLINNLNSNDSGQYTLKLQDLDGVQTAERSLQLIIQGTSELTVMAGVLSALFIFLAVGVAFFCAQRIKQNNKKKEEKGDVEQEITYADVRVVQQKGRQVEHKPDMEVEYDQVKFSVRPQKTE
ncbi:uncharacterized protein LOC133447561 isoform X2 [Cololabis saira]|uniref:uncharacterized protein LOC133447561 isoform X2 n=1 Tax=Cololabis saira TaxID=129043 RepID=UPI002AD56EAD|nr:uncharacterized protein LOC133447561 isoform X2 [Cololabis saira]